MNVVFVMTDTQNKSMVGAYGNPAVGTPNLDRLAAEGIRFERAYTACPLCTPARAGIFAGLYPQVAGPWCNNLAPHADVALWGTIFRHYGYRAAYTGKWHLDGAGYFGDGVPGGGFEPDWWYDGKRYAEDLGPERFEAYRKKTRTAADLRAWGFTEANCWGHRVADRAIDFLERVGEERFLLAVSFDEPHGPYVAPPAYWDQAPMDAYAKPATFGLLDEDKPSRQREAAARNGDPDWDDFKEARRKFIGCNCYVDYEIGRVLEAVQRLHGEDTMVIFTSDHGDMWGAHNLRSKGPQMYEETTNIPFLVKLPEGMEAPRGVASDALVSHLDILPTLLDYCGIETPPHLHGRGMRPVLENPSASYRDMAMVSYQRFAINHDMEAGFYPIRCMTDGRWKLTVNLLDTDELYDLETDPAERVNRIDDPTAAAERDRLHDAMILEMNRVRDPFRSVAWADRPWRADLPEEATTIKRRDKPRGFPFQPSGIEAH